MDDLVKRLIEANENGVQGCLGSDIFYLSAERIDFLNKKLEQSQQRVKELEERIKKIPTSLSSLICEGYLENEVDARELEVVMMKLRHRLLTTNNDSE